MHIFLFIFYSVVLCYLLPRTPLIKKSGIRPAFLLLLFGLRVLMGCLHNFIAYKYYPNHGDIWLFFQDSFITRHELFTNFKSFVADNSTLAYLPHNTIECMHVLLDFLSFDNLYVSTLLFSFFTFLGNIALFRAFNGLFKNNLLCALMVLVLPSILFWTSCIHTEGLLYAFLGFLFYYIYRLIQTGWDIRKAITCLLFFGLIAFFRPAVAISLLPAIGLWMAGRRDRIGTGGARPMHLAGIAIGVLVVLVLLLMIIPGLSSGILRNLSERQREFQALAGNSRIYLPVLEPTWSSVLRVLPFAVINGWFQPLPGSGGQPIYTLFSLELCGIWLIIAYAVVRKISGRPISSRSTSGRLASMRLNDDVSPSNFSVFGIGCLVFALLGMLIVGYIIPFAGAIVRYRSIYLPFLLAPFLDILRELPVIQKCNSWLRRKIIAP